MAYYLKLELLLSDLTYLDQRVFSEGKPENKWALLAHLMENDPTKVAFGEPTIAEEDSNPDPG